MGCGIQQVWEVTRTSTAEWHALRWIVLERDDFTCQYCGQRAPDVRLEVDHRIAVRDDGTDDLDNLVTACWSCNRGKEWSRWLLQEKKPARVTKTTGQGTQADVIEELLRTHGAMTPAELSDASGWNKSRLRDIAREARRKGHPVDFMDGAYFLNLADA